MADDIVHQIDRAAETIGCTRAEFIRWTAYSAACEVLAIAAKLKK